MIVMSNEVNIIKIADPTAHGASLKNLLNGIEVFLANEYTVFISSMKVIKLSCNLN
jgi:hypothetical protein